MVMYAQESANFITIAKRMKEPFRLLKSGKAVDSVNAIYYPVLKSSECHIPFTLMDILNGFKVQLMKPTSYGQLNLLLTV